MVLGITLIIIALMMLIGAIMLYAEDKMKHVFWILIAAGWLALTGAAVIDERNERDCVPIVESIEQGDS